MGIIKHRRKVTERGVLSVVGSAEFLGRTDVRTTLVIAGAATFNAAATFSASPVVNMPLTAPTGSAATQIAGYLRINSGAASATMSTTRLNSGAILIVGAPVLVGAPVASYNLVGELVVNTLAQAASGGYFTVGYAAPTIAYAANIDVPWFIINPA